MKNKKSLYLNVFLLSASILSFEIISTRISSVIFVNDNAFIILSLAILGLGCGSIYSYYRVNKNETTVFPFIARTMLVLGISIGGFILLVILTSITAPVLYFVLLFLPFFIAGIIYAQLFKMFAGVSFKLYASDLVGGAFGSVASLWIINIFGAPNGIVFIAVVVFATALLFFRGSIGRVSFLVASLVIGSAAALLAMNGEGTIAGKVPIGKFPAKDFYYVYSDPNIRPTIIDSRWSNYGRSDLVQYNNQDIVRQMFIDGSAGTQMYRFNGDITHVDRLLQGLLLHQSNAIPFLCLTKDQKDSMLVIGPGGGKEVLIGLLAEVKNITAVEVNPDFVQLVKDYKDFNGGIYTDFPNVRVLVQEGRHFVKRTTNKFDIVEMALPSTEQTQSIEPFAMSENYLLTEEALQDYLNILTPNGYLFLTVHNEWELVRLITTALSVFQKNGMQGDNIENHFAIFESEYSPTIVIKKNAFTAEEASHWQSVLHGLPSELPHASYLPFRSDANPQTTVNRFLQFTSQSIESLNDAVDHSPTDISPCTDDKPYFYNKDKAAPDEYVFLAGFLAVFNCLLIWIPGTVVRRTAGIKYFRKGMRLLSIFVILGAGFMLIEVSLFQKFILYLGSPTLSLSVLLSSLLVGMGTGSYFGKRFIGENISKRIFTTSLIVTCTGILLFIFSPSLLSNYVPESLVIRWIVCFSLILPFAFFLGIPFPSAIQLLDQNKMEKYIPWMYGVNGGMSVFGSVAAINISLTWGFTMTFIAGISLYGILALLLRPSLPGSEPYTATRM